MIEIFLLSQQEAEHVTAGRESVQNHGLGVGGRVFHATGSRVPSIFLFGFRFGMFQAPVWSPLPMIHYNGCNPQRTRGPHRCFPGCERVVETIAQAVEHIRSTVFATSPDESATKQSAVMSSGPTLTVLPRCSGPQLSHLCWLPTRRQGRGPLIRDPLRV